MFQAVPLPWAVHIADGVLSWPTLAGGFVLAALLAGLAAWRIREDEVPGVALLTAAFFAASSIHVKLGPSSVHLLLNGLVGVVLGRRAPLAILVGVTLQALLIPHGGISTIGVNACAEAVPALLAGGLFCLVSLVLQRRDRDVRLRSALVGLGGFVCGAVAVITTAALTGLVLLLDSDELWRTYVMVVFVPHLPLALLEGIIVAAIVAFLYRVKPEMLPAVRVKVDVANPPVVPSTAIQPGPPQAVGTGPVQALLAILSVLLLGGPARAHNLEVEHQVDRAAKRVTVKSFYETGDAPEKATARVLRGDGSVLAEGPLDEKGVFAFSYEKAENLSVHVRAPGGHRAVCLIRANELEEQATVSTEPAARGSRGRDLLLGVGLVLAAASFVMSWRNSARLRRLAEAVERRA
jgi:cobalt/nickel transport system permease protein